MAKLVFRPMPVLTVILAISVAILISLGIWQYQRLQWKTALLSEVEASVTAPPLRSLSDLNAAIQAGDPIDFRRIQIEASPVEDGPEFHLYKSQGGGIYWDVVEPLSQGALTILAKTETLNADQKENQEELPFVSERNNYTGYVRKTYEMGRVEGWVKSKANTDTNRYFHFNQTGDWYDGLPGQVLEGYYIDVEPSESADDLPVRRPKIANNHFDYMLTWWSFAIIFIIIYLLLHKRAGRLKFQ
jgi:surfeit locus 1 family protein